MDKNSDLDNLGFGGDSITSVWSLKRALYLLELAYDLGIRHFDTAPLYGQGYSEKIFGIFLKNKRSKVTLTTKFGYSEDIKKQNIPLEILLPSNYLIKYFRKKITAQHSKSDHSHKPIPFRVINKRVIEDSFKASLNSLKTDYLDFYLLHEGLPAFLTEDAFDFLFGLQKQGFVKKIGIGSNFIDIFNLSNDSINEWNILQYEGFDNMAVKEIMTKFPNQVHFHHGCLKRLNTVQEENSDYGMKGGHLLAKKVIGNSNGKVIFSSTNPKNIKNNIFDFLQYTSDFRV